MIIRVITIDGVKEVRVEAIQNSPDGLAVVTKWDDTEYAQSVVTPVPGTSIWMTVASRHDLLQPWFPHGQVAKSFDNLISRLPLLCSEYARAIKSTLSPVELALARYLGILTSDQVESHRLLFERDRQERQQETERRHQESLDKAERSLVEALSTFKRSEAISAEAFTMLLDRQGIKVPPRTAGALNEHLSQIRVLPDGRVETLGKKGWKPSNTVALLASKLFAS
jgi:hypothetical protein